MFWFQKINKQQSNKHTWSNKAAHKNESPWQYPNSLSKFAYAWHMIKNKNYSVHQNLWNDFVAENKTILRKMKQVNNDSYHLKQVYFAEFMQRFLTGSSSLFEVFVSGERAREVFLYGHFARALGSARQSVILIQLTLFSLCTVLRDRRRGGWGGGSGVWERQKQPDFASQRVGYSLLSDECAHLLRHSTGHRLCASAQSLPIEDRVAPTLEEGRVLHVATDHPTATCEGLFLLCVG